MRPVVICTSRGAGRALNENDFWALAAKVPEPGWPSSAVTNRPPMVAPSKGTTVPSDAPVRIEVPAGNSPAA